MLSWLVAVTVRGLAATWRVERPAWPVQGPCVVAFWHGETLAMVALHAGVVPLCGLTSRSADGERVAGVLRRLGFAVVRGSSSRGGAEALLACRGALRAGTWPCFAVDGPRGPAGTVAPGSEALARGEGVPVVYGRVRAAGWRARSWDRFLVPWPFARVRVEYGVWRPGAEPLAAAMAGLPPG